MSQEHGNIRCFRCGEAASTCTGGPSAEEVGQARRWQVAVLEVQATAGHMLAAVCCWPCFWALQPDLWVSAACWTQANPCVPVDRLPAFADTVLAITPSVIDDAYNPSRYPWPDGGDLKPQDKRTPT